LSYITSAYGKLCPQGGISLGGTLVYDIGDVPLEDTDDLTLNKTIKAGESRAMAGSEDCLHLAVFTPRVNSVPFMKKNQKIKISFV